MLINDTRLRSKTYTENVDELPTPARGETGLPTEAELFAIYEEIAETRPGTRDAEIFAKIREWTFSDYSTKPHEMAGISREELAAWQERHRINLSSGHIRPASIDLDRGHAWGHIRRSNHLNNFHSYDGPPSADELAFLFTSIPN